MTLLSKLSSFFGTGPKLRNRAGGLAFVKHYGQEYGADAIAGQVVTTERFADGFWMLTPQPRYTVTNFVRHAGEFTAPGTQVMVIGLPDELLDPIPDCGLSKEEVTELYAAPAKKKETA